MSAAAVILLLLVGGIGTTVGLIQAGAPRGSSRGSRPNAVDAERRCPSGPTGRAAREADADTKAFTEFLMNDVLSVALVSRDSRRPGR